MKRRRDDRDTAENTKTAREIAGKRTCRREAGAVRTQARA